MVWIAYNADHISVEMKKTEEHKDHASSVGWAWFNWYFATTNTTYIKTPVSFDTPYTIMENGTLGYTITYNTNGGSEVAKAENRLIFQKTYRFLQKRDMNLQAGIRTQHLQKECGQVLQWLKT